MKKLQSPLPWVGSKRKLRDTIIPLIPEHTCYAEPFAGGAWVYLGKEPSKVEAISDIDGDLINLYKVLRDQPNELADRLWFNLASRDLYSQSKTALVAEGMADPIQRAATFYFHIKNAFGARFGSGFAFSRNRPPRHVVAFDVLMELHARLQNTYIENLTFERFIKNYDSPETFFYCDPPYWMDKEGCYRYELNEAMHVRLSEILAGIKGKFLLSYGDKKEIRELYRGFKIELTEPIGYTLSGKQTYKRELLISNY